MEKIIFDTDIGSDIDDAVCLAYLLAQPACDLLGITTVSGEATRRAQIADALCKVAGRKIPIYPGSEKPLFIDQRQARAPQASVLKAWPHEKSFKKSTALRFMQDAIRANPHEVTLIAVGPLTNVGLLFAADPEIPSLLKRLVLMCGKFSNCWNGYGPLEWNATCDPHACDIVYRSKCRIHRSIGLDVTTQVSMAAADVRQRFKKNELLAAVLSFAEVWFRNQDRLVFHDPLAAATIFDNTICSFKKGTVEVELESARLRGYTHFSATGKGSPHEVALEVDSKKFSKHYFSLF